MLNSRQKAFCTTALITAASISPFGVNASSSAIIDEVQLVNTLHTHLYPSSKSLPSSKVIKTAAVCFINDTQPCNGDSFGGNDNDFELNDKDRCFNEGYKVTDCPDGYKPGGKKCPYGPYYSDCVSICPSSYVTCEPPYHGVGEACGGKYASCECTPCGVGYDYTTIPEGYIADGAACVDCDGATKYKIKINPCDGFQDCGSMGGEVGAKTCLSGSQIKYDNCKACPNLGTLSSCPSPFTCTYEECSNRYYKTGCQSGYNWNPSTQTCTQKCDSSYQYTCTGANESLSGTACGGKYKSCLCLNGYVWKNGACEACASSYKYMCNGEHESSGGLSCNGKYDYCRCIGDYTWNSKLGKCEDSCDSDFKYTCDRENEAGGAYASCNGRYMYCNCKSGYNWDWSNGGCVCKPSSQCDCLCNSTTDCSNCSSSNVRCVRTISDGCGGRCQQWGRWDGADEYTRNCINADGEIVLSYTVIGTLSGYSVKIYCDDVLTKSYGALPADVNMVAISPVVFPAEPVTCNKEWDFDDVRDDYTLTFDYNTKYCGGTAQSVTVEYGGVDVGQCRY